MQPWPATHQRCILGRQIRYPRQEDASLRAIVCIKSVPETTEVRINPETNTLMRSEVGSIINPFDMYAIEEALRLRERHGGTVTVLTMGPPQAEKELRDAVAMGCDDAVFLCSPAFAGSDTWATAYTLAQAVVKLGAYDVILCGKQAVDGDTGQVGPGIARQLGIPPLTYVSEIVSLDVEARRIVVRRLLEEGHELVATSLPAVLTMLKDINIPRFPTFRRIRRAQRLDIPIWTPDDLPGIEPHLLGLEGSPTRVTRIFAPSRHEERLQLFDGDTPQQAAVALAEQLIADRLV